MSSRKTLSSALEDAYGAGAKPSGVHEAIAGLPFAAAVTSNYDTLLEETFKDRSPESFKFGESGKLADCVRSGLFVILRLAGRFGEEDPLVITREDFVDVLRRNDLFSKVLASFFAVRTVLFIGMELQSIEELASDLRLRTKLGYKHYALVTRSQYTDFLESRLESFHGIRSIKLRFDDKPKGMTAFLDQLQLEVRECQASIKTTASAPRSITRVVLQNIGVFENLSFSIEPGWNLMLGDNGCGKSTLLKAIALCLCGETAGATEAAACLLRAGAEKGFVELGFGERTYRAELSREMTSVRVSFDGMSPLQLATLPILGFPPLRGASLGEIAGPSADPRPASPVVDDVLPLLAESVDGRMTDIRQWIVNLDYAAESEKKGASPGRSREILDDLFRTIDRIIPDISIRFARVDHDHMEVMVSTDDGEVPLRAVSQGMSSVIAWIGTLLQRMHDIHRGSSNPKAEPAIILLDEIDSHMHPFWQWQLASLLQGEFEQVQMIATTHSPLVLGDIRDGHVVVFSRDAQTGQVRHTVPDEDRTGMGVAGILMSAYFGLPTTLDRTTQDLLDRRARLMVKGEDRTEDEHTEMLILSDRLSTLGFHHVFDDPMFTAFCLAMAAHHEPKVSLTTPEQVREFDELAKRVISSLPRDEKQ